jgi:hypothetical protein
VIDFALALGVLLASELALGAWCFFTDNRRGRP